MQLLALLWKMEGRRLHSLYKIIRRKKKREREKFNSPRTLPIKANLYKKTKLEYFLKNFPNTRIIFVPMATMAAYFNNNNGKVTYKMSKRRRDGSDYIFIKI